MTLIASAVAAAVAAIAAVAATAAAVWWNPMELLGTKIRDGIEMWDMGVKLLGRPY